VNKAFQPIPRLNCISDSDKNKQGTICAALFILVRTTGRNANLLLKDLLEI